MSIVPETRAFAPEMAAQYAGHPAAVEAAASLVSRARGLRPQWSALPVGPSAGYTLRGSSLNARLSSLLTARQAQLAARGERVSVAEPQRLAFRSLLGARRVAHQLDLHGYALNLEFAYQSPSGAEYVLSGIVTGFADGPLTGEGWARECSCPDFQKRRGAGRDKLRGEARCCKHMRLFLLLASQWRGELPWVGAVPRFYQPAGKEAFQLREF